MTTGTMERTGPSGGAGTGEAAGGAGLPGLKLTRRGKVRDVYEAGPDRLVMVCTDRVSAFDRVLPTPVPGRGEVLNRMTAFWFERTAAIVPNVMLSTEPDDYPPEFRPHREALRGRSMLVERASPLPIECIARGYAAGSGWADYTRTGAICGHGLPGGLRESARLPRNLFRPSTKVEEGSGQVWLRPA